MLYRSNDDRIRNKMIFLLPNNTKCPVSLNGVHLLLMKLYLISCNSQPLSSLCYRENKDKNKGWTINNNMHNDNYDGGGSGCDFDHDHGYGHHSDNNNNNQ